MSRPWRRREHDIALTEHGTTIRVSSAHIKSFGSYKAVLGEVRKCAKLRIRLTFFGGDYVVVAHSFSFMCADRDNFLLTISNGCAEIQFTAVSSWYE